MYEEIEKLFYYFYYFSFIFEKKNFCKRNDNKLPKCAGPHLLRNVITLAAKQQNHRINKEHLTFQIEMLREVTFSSYTFIY